MSALRPIATELVRRNELPLDRRRLCGCEWAPPRLCRHTAASAAAARHLCRDDPAQCQHRRRTLGLTTLAVEALLDGEAETITRKAIKLAKDGNMAALRLCLDRIAPPRKDRPVLFELPPVSSAADATNAAIAKGLPLPRCFALMPRVLSREEWIEKYSPKQDVESR
jgi:hypothetical protein